MGRKVKDIVVGDVRRTATKHPETYVIRNIYSGRLEGGGIEVEFVGSGYTCCVDARRIHKGDFRSPFQPSVFGLGYMGVGHFQSAHPSGKSTDVYRRWKAILSRCYNPVPHDRDSSYKGCTVSDEWLNFQLFAEWLSGQKTYHLGYEIDKDLRVPGNKVYGPSTCCLLPPELNKALAVGPRASDLPLGVHYHKKNDCYVVAVAGGKRYKGSFKSVEDAWQAARLAKIAHVQDVASRYSHTLDTHVMDAIRRYEPLPFKQGEI